MTGPEIPDEAAIRADERAKTAREIHDELTRQAEQIRPRFAPPDQLTQARIDTALWLAAVAWGLRVPDCGHEWHGADGGPYPRCGHDVTETAVPIAPPCGRPRGDETPQPIVRSTPDPPRPSETATGPAADRERVFDELVALGQELRADGPTQEAP